MGDVIGQTIGGRYRIVRQLGRGGMATVYEAIDTQGDRRVAVKLLRASFSKLAQATRFQREVEALARLDHPNIVSVLNSGIQGEQHYYVMEFVAGWALSAVLAELREGGDACPEVGQLLTTLEDRRVAARSTVNTEAETVAPAAAAPVPEARSAAVEAESCPPRHIRERSYVLEMCRIALEAARALAHAHERGVIHRDVKPDNLLLDQAGNVRVTDFGLASVAGEQTLTVAGELMGTPLYMSPEQVAASRIPIDARTDVYSLGAALYEMLTLEPPHRTSTREGLLQAIAVKEPTPLRARNLGVPRALEAVVQCAIEKDRDRRYASMAEFAADLERFLEGRRVIAQPVGRVRRFWRRQSVAGQVTFVGAAVVLLLAAAGELMRNRPGADGPMTAEQRERWVAGGKRASLAGDWERALLCYARALPVEPRDVIGLRMQYASARLLPVGRRVPYLGPGRRVALHPEEPVLASCDRPHTARLVPFAEAGSEGVELRHQTDDFIHEVWFTPSGERVFTVGAQEVKCWTKGGEWIATYEVPRDRHVTRIETDRHGRWLLLEHTTTDQAEAARSVLLLDVSEDAGTIVPVLERSGMLDADLRDDGRMAVVLTGEGRVVVVGLGETASLADVVLPASGAAIGRVWCLAEGSKIVALDDRGRWHLYSWNGTDGDVRILAVQETGPAMTVVDMARAAVVPVGGAGRVVTAVPVRLDDGTTRFSVQVREGDEFLPVGEAQLCDGALVCPRGGRLAVRTSERLEVWEADGPRLVGHFPVGMPPTTAGEQALAWAGSVAVGDVGGVSADVRMRRVATACGPGYAVRVWDVDSRALLASWTSSSASLLWAALDPMGQHVLSGYRDGVIELRGLASAHLPGARVGNLPPGEPVLAASVGGEGIVLVTGEGGVPGQVWRLKAGEAAPLCSLAMAARVGDGIHQLAGRSCVVSQGGEWVGVVGDEGRVSVFGPDDVQCSLGVRAGSLSSFGFAVGGKDGRGRAERFLGVGGTENGRLVVFEGCDGAMPDGELTTKLGRIVAVTMMASQGTDGHALVALDEAMRCGLLIVPRIGSDKPVGDGTSVPHPLLRKEWGTAEVFTFALGGERLTERTIVALARTKSPRLYVLAVARGPLIDVWALEVPAFGQRVCKAYVLGAPFVLWPGDASSAEAEDGPCAEVVGMGFREPSEGCLELIVVTADGIVRRLAVLSDLPRVDASLPASDAWRRHVTAFVGRRLNTPDGSAETVSDSEWQAAREWAEEAGD